MDTVDVVCGIVCNDNLVLLARRKAHKFLGGFWEFPGGKIEGGETGEESLKRELQEELGMSVEIKSQVLTTTHSYEQITIKLMAYLCKFKHNAEVRTDHDELVWLPIENLLEYKIAPADDAIVQYLVDNKRLMNQILVASS